MFEHKFDGERVLAFRRERSVRLLSRNRISCTAAYPEIAEAIAAQPRASFVIDGEVVAFEAGVSNFAKLQPRMQVRDPESRRARAASRSATARSISCTSTVTTRHACRSSNARSCSVWRCAFGGPLRFSAHRATHGERLLSEACRRGLEGLIAKRADAQYVHRRSTDWLKLKCTKEQEFVVGGYSDPKGARVGLGALLLGYYEQRKLKYAGEVGTGFSNQMLQQLREQLSRLEQPAPPFEGEALPRSGVHWVRPRLVAQIAFTEWTRDGKLRHPRFKGLRRDKRPQEVTRERAS